MVHFEGHAAAVHSLAFSPDSMLLATGAKDGTVRVWDPGGSVVREFASAGGNPIQAVAWHPGGERLYFSDGSTLTDVEVTSGATTGTLFVPTAAEITTLAFVSADHLGVGLGKRGGSTMGPLAVWHIGLRKKQLELYLGNAGIRAVAGHPSTKTFAVANADRLLRVATIASQDKWDIKLERSCSAVALSPDGKTLAAALDWIVRLFNIDSRTPRLDLPRLQGVVSGVAFSPDGRTLACTCWDETVRLHDVPSATTRGTYPLGIGKPLALAYAPDGTRLAIAGLSGTVLVMDVE